MIIDTHHEARYIELSEDECNELGDRYTAAEEYCNNDFSEGKISVHKLANELPKLDFLTFFNIDRPYLR